MPASVRYIVSDIDAAVAFYAGQLGSQVARRAGPGFPSLSRGDLRLLINRPGAGGAGQSMPDGQAPVPGGWNRIVIEVRDLDQMVAQLREAGSRFRNEIVTGNGGKQILLEGPSGTVMELSQPFNQAGRP